MARLTVFVDEAMDLEVKVQHPNLKGLIDLSTKLAITPTESANDFRVRVEEEMEVGGIGS